MVEQTRVAVVTGGNRGIGLEICRQLAEHGVHVILTSRDPDKGQSATKELTDDGLDVEYRQLDVLDRAAIGELAAYVRDTYGGVDILVNNAGVAQSGFDSDVVRLTVDTNVFAPLELGDALLPIMRAGGRIVMVSSGMAERSCLSEDLAERFMHDMSRDEFVGLMRGFVSAVAEGTHEQAGWPSSAYRVSKLAMNKLAEIMGQELDAEGNPQGILVNSSCPGWVRTDMGGPHAPRSPREGADTPVWLALLDETGPQGGFFRDREPASW
jgi:NAD(P)-dependent dehydrogenase (short-subunit alcohol dehydrogenase family)